MESDLKRDIWIYNKNKNRMRIKKSMSAVMISEVKIQLKVRNVVASDDGGGKNTPTVTSSG